MMIIYLIINKINGQLYVGQTVSSLEARWRGYCCAANTNKPTVIARAIRKYGRNNFTIVQIDTAKNSKELCKKEAHYAKIFDTYAPNGYNVQKCGIQTLKWSQATMDKRTKVYSFISPKGKTIKIKNLKKFCENNGLDHCHMYHVAQGKREAHRGWRSLKRSHLVFFLKNIITGEKLEVLDCYGFKRPLAKIMNINEGSLSGLLSGKLLISNFWGLFQTKTINP